MGKAKKRISALLVFVFSFFSILSYFPGQAFAKTNPKVQSVISGVAYKYSAGDKALMKLTASTTSAVQYRVFVKNSHEKAPVEVTKGYTKLVRGKLPQTISLPTSKEGVNTVTVYVRKAGSKAKYDSYKRTTYYVVKPQATVSGIMPKYNLGAKAAVRLASVNAGASTVQYRFFVKNAHDKTPVEVTKGYTKLVKSNTLYTITLPTSKEGLNTVTVYVRRAGSKASYDNYRRIQYIVVKTPVVLSKAGAVYGSSDANKILAVNNDVYVSANNITLNNLKVNGTIYVNPGNDGNADLNNVTATNIVVQSGGQNSIHFNGVKVEKILTVAAKEAVRIETKGTTSIASTVVKSSAILDTAQGSFGNVEILGSTLEAQTVELRGTFDKAVTVEGQVTLKAADNANIVKIDVNAKNSNAAIKFEGKTFTNVEINSTAKIIIPEGTKITMKVNVDGANIDVASGADVNIDANGKNVDVTGGGSGSAVVTNPSVPDNNSVLNNHINLLIGVFNSHTTLNDDIKVNPIALPGSTQNPAINFTVNQQYKDNSFLGMVNMITNKLSTRPDNSDIAAWVTKVLISNKINVGNESLRAYVVGKIGDTAELQTVKTILGHKTITNDDINSLVSLLSNNDSLVKVQQILAAINGDVTITSPVVVDGLTLSSVSIGNTVIYSTTQKTITESNVRAALGMPTTPAGAMTVNNFVNKPVKVTFTDSEGSYSYTLTLTGFNN